MTESDARSLVVDMLRAYGATESSSLIVADHLVDADRAGVSSHGLLRVPQYVDEILSGELDPAVVPQARRREGLRLEVDGARGFGQVACILAAEEGAALAREHGMALVNARNMGHAGRLGAYPEALGRQGFLAVLMCSGARSGHRVAPFNGRDARLATNPIAYSIPTEAEPIVGDFSTAAAPEGRIRHLFNIGEQAPPDTLIDGGGEPTSDPGVLYQPSPGTILPLGGSRLGHRGFALSLLVEAFATLLAGEETEDASRRQNSVAMIIVAVDRGYRGRAQRMADYVTSSRPRAGETVLLPGQLEQRRRAASRTITVEERVWNAIVDRAARRAVPLPTANREDRSTPTRD